MILGAGRGVRGSLPSAIVDIDDDTRVMDWLLDAFTALGDFDVCFIGGFRADEVMERYPQIRTVFNRELGRYRSGGVPGARAARPRSVYVRLLFGCGVSPVGSRRVARHGRRCCHCRRYEMA